MAYTTPTLVTDWLGTAYDSTNDLTTAEVTAFIVEADGLVDDAASEIYLPFNAVDSSKSDGTDTYTTPKTAAMASRHLAVAFCFDQLRGQASNATLENQWQRHLDQGTFYLSMLGDADKKLPPEKYRAETLTWGTASNSWDLNTDQAFIGLGSNILDSGDPPHIIATSVAIDSSETMRNGVEYKVAWSNQYRRWVFTALSSDVTDLGASINVTYLWDYQRDFANEASWSGVLLSG